MATKYAADTKVTVQRSRNEIEALLERYDATGFLYGRHRASEYLAFEIGGRQYRFTLRLPSMENFSHTEPNERGYTRRRTETQAQAAYNKESRRVWRELVLYIKAVLAVSDSGIITLEEALLGYAVTPQNTTVAEWLLPQLDDAKRNGRMPPLLPGA